MEATPRTAETDLRADPEHPEEPDRVGYSLANVVEVLVACLDAAGVSSVVEVGADRGLLTRELLDRAGGERGVTAIDPAPARSLEALQRERPELELIRETSHDALRHVEMPDAIVIDGDHNYFTVSTELRIIGERAPGADLPLLLFHDVCWPHARRDSYYVPERIPEEHRQPLVRDSAILPGEPGTVESGLPVECAAEREGGERNGVLTAIEDFVSSREGLELAAIPAFFGLGVLWHREAPWAGAVEAVVRPLDRHPVLERLEGNRVDHLAGRLSAFRVMMNQHDDIERLTGERDRLAATAARQEDLLRRMLDSSAFGLAERVSRLRQGGRPMFSRDEVRRAIDG
ncbi:MAG: class I SAM-dependent methyltransferase [Solirubrobacterales bacterium]|nr:class I SAM-dependent methyltransferase [Solirubrobacterales bacterium]